MDYSGQNINRVNAIKQLKKGIKNESDIEVLGSIANSFVYIGDMIKEHNDILKLEIESAEKTLHPLKTYDIDKEEFIESEAV